MQYLTKRGNRNKKPNEVKPVENINKNPQSYEYKKYQNKEY